VDLVKPPMMFATEESSRSNSKSEKNRSADYSNYNVRMLNTIPKDAHLHKQDAVQGYVDSEEGDDDLSSDPVQRHVECVRTL
jgi:hypothetical protein